MNEQTNCAKKTTHTHSHAKKQRNALTRCQWSKRTKQKAQMLRVVIARAREQVSTLLN